jgi:hypothetical protein
MEQLNSNLKFLSHYGYNKYLSESDKWWWLKRHLSGKEGEDFIMPIATVILRQAFTVASGEIQGGSSL